MKNKKSKPFGKKASHAPQNRSSGESSSTRQAHGDSPRRKGFGHGSRTSKPKPYFKPKSNKPPAKATREAPRPSTQGVLLWGVHAVHEAWLNPNRTCYRLWVTEAGREALAGAFAAAVLDDMKRPQPLLVERQELDRLLPPNAVHQGVALDAAPLPDQPLHTLLKVTDQPDLLVVLDQVTDPHNVGAILRSAAAFGASAVIMTERNAPATTGILAKTASGAVEHVPLVYVTNLVRALADLQEAGYWCVGLAEEATKDIAELDLSARTALVLGAEGDGLRRLTRENCDELARLPTGGAIGSLNVSNAAAIALYEARKQKKDFE